MYIYIFYGTQSNYQVKSDNIITTYNILLIIITIIIYDVYIIMYTNSRILQIALLHAAGIE